MPEHEMFLGKRVVHVNASDTQGGAARAAARLHSAQNRIGLDSAMLVQEKQGDDPRVRGAASKPGQVWAKIRPHLDGVPVRRYGRNAIGAFSPAILPGRSVDQILQMAPAVVNFHWLAKGFVRIESLKRLSHLPVIWTLHDSWAFTGGCHVPYECLNYMQSCGNCPVLGSNARPDLSTRVWRRKKAVYPSMNLTIVTPSRWLGRCAQSSALLGYKRIEVIPNGIDLQRYKPLDQTFSRDVFSLPRDKRIIMFGAMYSTADRNKGFHHLVAALREIACTSYRHEVQAVVLGAEKPEEMPDVGVDVKFLGCLRDDASLAIAYSAADVFVAPSIQENLSNSVMESMACGTPCVAFEIGGMPDMIDHQRTGYLVRPYSEEGLASGILWTIDAQAKSGEIGWAARQKVEEEYSDIHIAYRYAELYADLQRG